MKRSRRTASALCVLPLVGLLLVGCSDPSSTAGDSAGTPKRAAIEVEEDADAASLVPDTYRERGFIISGFNHGAAPMAFVGEDGKTVEGVEPDLLRAVGQVLGLDVKFEQVNGTYMPQILSKRFDVVVGSITATLERQQEANFVVYAEYGQALMTLADHDDVTFENICGKSVGVSDGAIQQIELLPEITEECLADGKPAPVEMGFADVPAMELAVVSGRVDTVFLNEVLVRDMADKSAGKLVMTDTGSEVDPKGILVGKESGLTEALFAAVQVLHRDGVLEEIFDSAGLEDVVLSEPGVNTAWR